MNEIIHDLHKSDVFCIAPWIQLYLKPGGFMCSCCVGYNEKYQYGNINETPINELWQGQDIRNFRLKLLSGEKDERCRYCYDLENAGVESYRHIYNNDFADYLPWAKTTDPITGYAPDAKPVFLDIRFSNKCNLRCRMCSHIFSSAWYQESCLFPGMPTMPGQAIINCANDTKALLNEIFSYLPEVRRVYFAGGEPLITDEYYTILQKLNEYGLNNNVDVFTNTNFSITRYHGNDVFLLWNKFKNIFIRASLDANYERGEYIRSGLNWQQVVNNRRRMLQVCPEVNFMLNPTVGVFNALHLPDFHREWVEQGLVAIECIDLNMLDFPIHLSARILPEKLKDEVEKKYHDHVGWIKRNASHLSNNALNKIISKWLNCVAFIKGKNLTSKLIEFLYYTYKLDAARNESFIKTFPELKELDNYTMKATNKLSPGEMSETQTIPQCGKKGVYYLDRRCTFIIDRHIIKAMTDRQKIIIGIGNEHEAIELFGYLEYNNNKIPLDDWYKKIELTPDNDRREIVFTVISPIRRHVGITWWIENCNESVGQPERIEDIDDDSIQLLNVISKPLQCSVESIQSFAIHHSMLPHASQYGTIVIQIAVDDRMNQELNGWLEYNDCKQAVTGWYTDIHLHDIPMHDTLFFTLNMPIKRDIQLVWWPEPSPRD